MTCSDAAAAEAVIRVRNGQNEPALLFAVSEGSVFGELDLTPCAVCFWWWCLRLNQVRLKNLPKVFVLNLPVWEGVLLELSRREARGGAPADVTVSCVRRGPDLVGSGG